MYFSLQRQVGWCGNVNKKIVLLNNLPPWRMFSKFIPVYLRCLYFVKAVSDMNDSMTRTSGLVSSEFTLHRSPSTDVTIYVLDVGRLSPVSPLSPGIQFPSPPGRLRGHCPYPFTPHPRTHGTLTISHGRCSFTHSAYTSLLCFPS